MAKVVNRFREILGDSDYIAIAQDMAEWMSSAELAQFIKDTVPFWKRDSVFRAVGLI